MVNKKGIERGELLGLIIAAIIIAGFFVVYGILKSKDTTIIESIKNLLRFGR